MGYLLQRSFSFMDRGVVFKIVARYLEAFSVRENIVSFIGGGGRGCVYVHVHVNACQYNRPLYSGHP